MMKISFRNFKQYQESHRTHKAKQSNQNNKDKDSPGFIPMFLSKIIFIM